MKKINISTSKHPNIFALVDNADYEWLSQWKWRLWTNGKHNYAIRTSSIIEGLRTTILMHRCILKLGNKLDIDHRNHNGLDNQKCNLRICTRSQNMHNAISRKGSSQYKSVNWDKQLQKWYT